LVLSLIMLASSGLLFYFERPVNDEIKTYWDALYASLVTWTTPGYGDILPVTTGGRISGLVLIISGLITWGLLIANLAAFLTSWRTQRQGKDPGIADLQSKPSQIDHLGEGELTCLRGALTALIDAIIEKAKTGIGQQDGRLLSRKL